MIHSMENETCQLLQWDTDFFGFRIAKVISGRLNEDLIKPVNNWCRQNRIDCLYLLIESDDIQSIRSAEDQDYRLVEVRINLERWLKTWNPITRPHIENNVLVRPIQPSDISTLLEIAKTAYIDSRFYFDKHFPEDKWQAYYATWVKKSCEGGAPIALTAIKNNEIVGYITGQIDKETPTKGQYELTGVRESARKAGVGQELFCSGIDEFVRRGVEYLWVSTQGRNVTTQRMIQRHGFLTRSCQLYYHKWFND
jgi:dTDP-4-amino-4,6-dideoxy-D-galactose acyltransferase